MARFVPAVLLVAGLLLPPETAPGQKGGAPSPKGGSAEAGDGGVGARRSISIGELRRMDVIGVLGVPLGTMAEVEGEVVSGDSLHMKAYAGRYLLKVTSAGGKAVAGEPVVEFGADVDAALPHNAFGLYRVKNGRDAKSLDAAQIAELEKGFVGTRVRVLAYETGGFRGIPEGVPQEMVWADRGFGFETRLSVLKRL